MIKTEDVMNEFLNTKKYQSAKSWNMDTYDVENERTKENTIVFEYKNGNGVCILNKSVFENLPKSKQNKILKRFGEQNEKKQ